MVAYSCNEIAYTAATNRADDASHEIPAAQVTARAFFSSTTGCMMREKD
jgi:hypothetical protein